MNETDRKTAPGQPDLFTERGAAAHEPAPPAVALSAETPAEKLTDEELLQRVPHAGLYNVDTICTQLVDRSLEASVPALKALWRRFIGYGIERPLREQLAVLDTLARLESANARVALRRIALSRGLPASLKLAALRAAAHARLDLPGAFVGLFLGHRDNTVREAAFALAVRSNVAAELLRVGLKDRSATNRRLAAIALGLRGDVTVRQPLYQELARSPSAEVIEAIVEIRDDNAIVHLGRCARRHPRLAGLVLDALGEMGSPRAETVARQLKSNTGGATQAGE